MVSVGDKRQAGFDIVIVIIAIVVLVGLGFIGWKLYSSYNKPAAQTATNNKQSSSSTSTQPIATYLDIKELGIKIKLDGSLKDATYTVSTNLDGSQTAYISTASLANASNGSCSSQKGGFASILETKGTLPEVFGTTLQPNGTTVFKIGTDTYVYIGSPNAECSESSSVNALFSEQRQAFLDDFKTVQLDN